MTGALPTGDADTDVLSQPVDCLKGVGAQIRRRLANLGIENLLDLLLTFPLRYEDRTRITDVAHCLADMPAQVCVRVMKQQVLYAPKPRLVVRAADASGELDLVFFRFYANQRRSLQEGQRLLCFATVRAGRSLPQMIHPQWRTLAPEERPQLPDHMTPVYGQREGLSGGQFAKWVRQACDLLEREALPREYLPQWVLQKYAMPDFHQSLKQLHFPTVETSAALLQQQMHPAQYRMAFEELLCHQMAVRRRRQAVRHQAAPPVPRPADGQQTPTLPLPFELTRSQKQALEVILADMARARPMCRLLQGDVGSGKTVVAALAMAAAAEQGMQCALMAPTEVLAEQHYRTVAAWLQPAGKRVCLLTGGMEPVQKQANLTAIASGDMDVVIGTHALIQKTVQFHCLALAIIDEQHRFGVAQRQALMGKGGQRPHQLVMSATPIPRSLAMTVYGDLDCTVIDELPPGRLEVDTVVLAESRRADVIDRIHRAIGEGRQVYWVCPLIQESDTLQCQAAEQTAAHLKHKLPEVTVDLVHGRMPARTKETALAGFAAGETRLLVATTVIEVGVDVPNASLMVIENAERLGLSQLHQLRGRVGRGDRQSTCVLMYKPPLTPTAKKRLAVIRRHRDGFRIADEDLSLRGPGELLGQRQTGQPLFRIADLHQHRALLDDVMETAGQMQSHPDALARLQRTWMRNHTNGHPREPLADPLQA